MARCRIRFFRISLVPTRDLREGVEDDLSCHPLDGVSAVVKRRSRSPTPKPSGRSSRLGMPSHQILAGNSERSIPKSGVGVHHSSRTIEGADERLNRLLKQQAEKGASPGAMSDCSMKDLPEGSPDDQVVTMSSTVTSPHPAFPFVNPVPMMQCPFAGTVPGDFALRTLPAASKQEQLSPGGFQSSFTGLGPLEAISKVSPVTPVRVEESSSSTDVPMRNATQRVLLSSAHQSMMMQGPSNSHEVPDPVLLAQRLADEQWQQRVATKRPLEDDKRTAANIDTSNIRLTTSSTTSRNFILRKSHESRS